MFFPYSSFTDIFFFARTVTKKKKLRGHLRAHLLVDGLFEVLRVDDGPDFSGRIGGPVGRHDLDLALAGVDPSALRALIVPEVLSRVSDVAEERLSSGFSSRIRSGIEVQIRDARLRRSFPFPAGPVLGRSHVELPVHPLHQCLVLVYE
jgi:hypothetical protein